MLIGKDFDKIEFSFFGLNLLEPNAFIGDSIILITAIFLASKLRRFDMSNPFFKNWRYFFLLFGCGMFLGGVGHLIFNYFGFYGKYIPWLMGIWAVYFIEKAMISLLKNNYKALLNKVILFKLFLFLSLEIFVFCFIDMSEDHSIGLRVPAINSTIGFIFSLGFLGYKFSKEIDKNFIYFLYSVLLMIPSGIFITYKINIHPWFDKNDFGHLILVLTMIFFYRAIKSYSDILLKEN